MLQQNSGGWTLFGQNFFHDGKNYGKLFSKTTSCYDQESIATEVHNFFPLSFFFFLGNTFLSGIMEIG